MVPAAAPPTIIRSVQMVDMSYENKENYMNMSVSKTSNIPKIPKSPVDKTKNIIGVTAQRQVHDDNEEKDMYEEIAPILPEKAVQRKPAAPTPTDSGYSGSPKVPPRRWVRPTNNIGPPSNGHQQDATLQPVPASRDLRATESPVVQPRLENHSSTESNNQDENPYDDPNFMDAKVDVDVSPAQNGYHSNEGGLTTDDVNDVEEYDFDDECGSANSNRPSTSRLNSTEHDYADDSSSQRSYPENSPSAGATKTAVDTRHSSNKSKSNTMLKMFTLKKSSGKDQTEPSGGGRVDTGAKSNSIFRLNLLSSKDDAVISGDDQQEPQKPKKKNSLTGSGDTIRAAGSKLAGVGAHLSTLIGKSRSSPRPSLSSSSDPFAADALPARSPCTPVFAADVDECSINSSDRLRLQQLQFHQRLEQTMPAELLQKLTSDQFTAATVRTLSRDEVSDIMHHVIQLPLKAVAQLYGKDVNGSLLVHLTVDDLVEALKLDRIDAIKVRQFAVDGWLPDRLKFAIPREATDDSMQTAIDAIDRVNGSA